MTTFLPVTLLQSDSLMSYFAGVLKVGYCEVAQS